MTATQRDFLSLAFGILVVALAAWVAHRFFVPVLWGGVLAIATWPLCRRAVHACGGRAGPAAALMTAGVLLVFAIPLALGLLQLSREAPQLARVIADANTAGIAMPPWLPRLPLLGSEAAQWWSVTLGQPHGLAHLLAEPAISRFLSPNEVLRAFGAQTVHRLVDAGFSFLCLFFFYKDGITLSRGIRRNMARIFGDEAARRYADAVPVAIRATVNGLVLVGLAEGLVIGIAYFLTGLPSPALWAFGTGALAIVPFGAPVVYLAASLVLAVNGNPTGAAIVAAVGTLVLFIADHFVRPQLIGSATRLPFLAVLFGILGGVEVMGLVGLFIGPVVMALFVTLWNGQRGSPDTPVHAGDAP